MALSLPFSSLMLNLPTVSKEMVTFFVIIAFSSHP